MQVRHLIPPDRSQWERLWVGYLTFYGQELDSAITDLTWSRLLGEDPAVVGLAATDGDELVGLCHLVFHPSTWSAAPYCYLEDLFVLPDRRRAGIGRALIAAAVTESQQAGAAKLYWQTAASNEVARRLYDAVAEYRGFIVYEANPTE
ncbi:MAG: N-acetyltransferase family protein [Actinomycetes bacterium]